MSRWNPSRCLNANEVLQIYLEIRRKSEGRWRTRGDRHSSPWSYELCSSHLEMSPPSSCFDFCVVERCSSNQIEFCLCFRWDCDYEPKTWSLGSMSRRSPLQQCEWAVCREMCRTGDSRVPEKCIKIIQKLLYHLCHRFANKKYLPVLKGSIGSFV